MAHWGPASYPLPHAMITRTWINTILCRTIGLFSPHKPTAEGTGEAAALAFPSTKVSAEQKNVNAAHEQFSQAM
jgi:hypothetical protein